MIKWKKIIFNRSNKITKIDNIKSLLSVCKSKSDTANVYRNIADMYRVYGMYDKNIEYVNKTIDIRKQYQQFMRYFHLYYHTHTYNAQNGKYDEGYKDLKEFESTLQMPFSEFTIVNQVEFYIAGEKWEILRDILPKVKQVCKDWGFVYDGVVTAEAYISEYLDKDYSKAIELHEQVLEQNPSYRLSDIHINIARCYRLLKKHNKAIDKLNFVANSSLTYNIDANYELSIIYKEKGNIKKAINYIDLMLDHYKDADPTLIKVNRAKALKEDLISKL